MCRIPQATHLQRHAVAQAQPGQAAESPKRLWQALKTGASDDKVSQLCQLSNRLWQRINQTMTTQGQLLQGCSTRIVCNTSLYELELCLLTWAGSSMLLLSFCLHKMMLSQSTFF